LEKDSGEMVMVFEQKKIGKKLSYGMEGNV
jgi:hypothetical protein